MITNECPGDFDFSIVSVNSKSEIGQKKDFPSNANKNHKQMFDGNVINTDKQSGLPHLSSKGDIQENAKTTDIDDQVNAKATDTVGDKKNSYSGSISVPDTDIFDFEKNRDTNLFGVGQI